MNSRHFLLIAISIFFALVMALMPLPISFEPYRPDWVLMVLMYWSLAVPHRLNIGTAWVVGLLMDLASGSPLGVNSLTYSVCIFITASNFQKIRNFSLWQQSILIALFLTLYHLMQFWLNHFLMGVYFSPHYMWPVLTGMLCWWWIFLILRKYRRHFRIR
ncbi:rod shape-determining protein MreD [Pseudoalteromonas shioyasakiensis]|jgi:rod shape-determining protein MreD|uniref:Rod shape-determining protein MreD n=1 Tax=Pseudoalteromonas shioyasakiensis TaxID=1190813 RepID=A0ABT6U4R0_9GAMM|nr:MULTISPECIES: rod shape-determining protein MreD [Pseudoalteromonas]MDC3191170.1 rod shape-determining protein MreD [Pseudoalteromonas elyakovii]KTG22287.1 rod shape-determining protein MreD [Pseudoalteromonas sp. XI10]KZY41371.1 rod shape-determining protein MreD [Pseudoalteromonas shioyasakiensis]MCG9733975.1 rod shape-determining protein MreD [Pseudoalteromonas shioyasakiensis]MCK8129800.1 rod shape-determining protein MreD [Pseudoalteromonas sp. 2CM39R]